jgi:DNA repair exonuclease SbcCD nuclease subunit
MSKYIYFQDAHVKGVNPARRTDNYYESWILKFKELVSIAKVQKADGIIDGGDLLDIPCVADSIVDDILDIIEEAGIPFYLMFGNHPMIGHHRETSKGTSLAHMIRRCKLLKEVHEIQDDNATIKMVEYDHNIEQKILDSGIMMDGSDDKWKVAIVHAFVTPKPFLPDVLHVVADKIVTNAELILVAHYHEPWKKKVKKTQYLDIGCFGRCSIGEAHIEPSVLLLDTKLRNYEVIKLSSAKKGEDVFDLSKKEQEETNDQALETFIASLKDFKGQELDLRGIIEHIGKEQKIDRAVIDIVLKKLEEVK